MRCYTVDDGAVSTSISTTSVDTLSPEGLIKVGEVYITIPEGSDLHYSRLESVPDPFGSTNSILLLLKFERNDVKHSKSNAEWRFRAIKYLKERKVKVWRGMINPTEEEEDIELKLSFMALIVGQKVENGHQALGILPEGRSFEMYWSGGGGVRQFLNQEGNLIIIDPLANACMEVLSEVWGKIYQR